MLDSAYLRPCLTSVVGNELAMSVMVKGGAIIVMCAMNVLPLDSDNACDSKSIRSTWGHT